MNTFAVLPALLIAACACIVAPKAIAVGVPLIPVLSVMLGPGAVNGIVYESGTWKELSPMPVARHDHELLAYEGKLYAISGAHDLTIADVNVYDPETDTWSELAPIPEKRGWFGAVLVDGKIYCMGGKRVRPPEEREQTGDRAIFEYRDSLHIYDIETNTWSTGASLSTPRAGLRAATCGKKIYTIGGYNPVLGKMFEIYDIDSDTWHLAEPLEEERMAPSLEIVNGKLYVIGGFAFGPNRHLDTVLIYDPDTEQWSEGSRMPTPRRDMITVVISNRIYCISGCNSDGYRDEVEIYDTETDTWSIGTPFPEAKAWAGGDVIDGRIYLAGGARKREPKGFLWLNEMHVYIPDGR